MIFLQRFLIFWTVFAVGLAALGQSAYQEEVLAHRDSLDKEFSDPERSILRKEDVQVFHGLAYFPVDKHYRVRAHFHPISGKEAVNMKTSGTRTPLFRPYGTLHFRLHRQKAVLTLYQSADPDRPELDTYLLLAFTDLTNGVETYGGGRYLEFNTDEVNHTMILDFNYSFNPYCAYNPRYSCVTPPEENDLPLRVEAGPMKFHD